MDISPLHAKINPVDLSLDQLAKNGQLSQEQKVGELSRQFEALLMRQILTESQKPVFKSKYTDNSAVSGIYKDMVTEHLADAMSKSGSFGLAKNLQSQLARQIDKSK